MTESFTFTGSEQTYTAASGVTSITVALAGAAGGSSNPLADGGGLGGYASLSIPVTPGRTYTIKVGGRGATADDSSRGGWPDGGYAAILEDGTPLTVAGDGGGSTSIWDGTDLLAIVGGGGGEGEGAKLGGNGSLTDGEDGADYSGAGNGEGGKGGTPSAGGAGGQSGWPPLSHEPPEPGDVTYTNGLDGSSLQGGDGGYFTGTGDTGTLGGLYGGAGGGGGGYFGGGGAGSTVLRAGGGGGGGSGFVAEGVTVIDSGVAETWGDGAVFIDEVSVPAGGFGFNLTLGPRGPGFH